MLLLPAAVEVPVPPDTTGTDWETRVSLVGGVGRYAIIDRGCEGQVLATHPRKFVEHGAEVQHRFANGITFGVRGGGVREKSETRFTVYDYRTYPYRESLVVLHNEWTNEYINPWLGLERPRVGIGIGRVWSRRPFAVASGGGVKIDPSFHVRIGYLDRGYFRVSFMESVPLYSGGGYFELGGGAHMSRNWDMYLGFNPGAPYDGLGLVLGLEYRASPNLAITARARLGESAGGPQSGFGLGIIYTTRPPVPRRQDL